MAVKKDYDLGHIELGDCYRDGVGVEKNEESAMACYRLVTYISGRSNYRYDAESRLKALQRKVDIQKVINFAASKNAATNLRQMSQEVSVNMRLDSLQNQLLEQSKLIIDNNKENEKLKNEIQ